VKKLFNSALDQPQDERDDFLTRAAGEDSSLRESVARLLASHDEGDGFMETPAASLRESPSTDLADDALPSGGRIGPYRLLREIGRGGMGTVYLAARDDGEFRHQVAVKVVKRGMDTDSILRRFRYERQILAGIDHPNVARLLDGGTTDDGRPYFVMEHIEGDPIDVYCSKHGLSINERLELFRTVCSAVEYAHQNLIVHRDIKSSNILVTTSGVPKLLDFGIAKLLDPSLAGIDTGAPATMRAMTPEYASPEQVRGEPITTASDVYSLGVLLYEILTGRRPYEVNSSRPEEIARIVCETDPMPPSQASAGRNLNGDRRRLRGDLDTIVLMAMQKEPRRRYASVAKFSDDIRRCLNNLPVTAQRDTRRYRTTRFIRRNRVVVVTASAVLVSLVAGLATTMWQAKVARDERARAERRFSEVRSLATSFLFELHDAIAPLPGSTPVRALLVKRALTSLDGLAREANGDVSLQRDLAAAYEKVGRVQGNSYNANLGDTKGALASYRKSLEIRERVARDNPKSLDLQDELASGYHGVADIYSGIGELQQAADAYQRAIMIRRRLREARPADVNNRVQLAELYNFLGDAQGMEGYANLGNVKGALANYRNSVNLREELLKSAPQSRDYRVGLANSLMNLGFLGSSNGDTTGAGQVRRSVELLERVLSENPDDAVRQIELLSAYARLRYVLADEGLIKEAMAIDRRSIAMLEQMIATDPSNNLFRRNLGAIYNYLGRDLRSADSAALAVSIHRKALGIAEALAAADSKSSEHKHDVAFTHYLLAEALSDTRDDAASLSEYNRAASQKEALRKAEPSNTRHGDDLALIYTGMSRVLTRTGKFAAAQLTIEKAIPLAEATAARSKTNTKASVNLASTYLGAGKLHAAMTSGMGTDKAKQEELLQARTFLMKGAGIWQTLQGQHPLTASQASRMAENVQELSRCNSALAHLHA
jgi:serine/threonine protein kinase/tetratricopeptide (TPR) repeat protein